MSDRSEPVRLPRYECTMALKYSSGIAYDPDDYGLIHLGSDSMSMICGMKGLGVFQDKISKQIFWGEWSDNCELHVKRQGDYEWGCWLLPPERLERFEHFVLGWACEYWSYDHVQRLKIIATVREAMKESPDDDTLELFYRRENHKEKLDWVAPWEVGTTPRNEGEQE